MVFYKNLHFIYQVFASTAYELSHIVFKFFALYLQNVGCSCPTGGLSFLFQEISILSLVMHRLWKGMSSSELQQQQTQKFYLLWMRAHSSSASCHLVNEAAVLWAKTSMKYWLNLYYFQATLFKLICILTWKLFKGLASSKWSVPLSLSQQFTNLVYGFSSSKLSRITHL